MRDRSFKPATPSSFNLNSGNRLDTHVPSLGESKVRLVLVSVNAEAINIKREIARKAWEKFPEESKGLRIQHNHC